MDKDDPILVAGAGGFIGGHLVADLRRQGYGTVRAVDIKPLDRWFQRFEDAENVKLDLMDPAGCREAVRGMRTVINLAADEGGAGYAGRYRTAGMLPAVVNAQLLSAAREAGTERFFFSSSACVYPTRRQSDPDVVPLREEDAYPAMAEDGHGWEKLFSEQMCRHFREDFGIRTQVVRYHNVYGPYAAFDGGREKAPAAICRKIIEAKLSGRHEIEIWGDGQQTRSFLYIDDCIDGTRRILDSGIEGPVNLGSDRLVSINDLLDIAERIAGIALRRHYRPEAPQGVRGRNCNNARLRAQLGWVPQTRLEDGMERTYRWIYNRLALRNAA